MFPGHLPCVSPVPGTGDTALMEEACGGALANVPHLRV